ncbi:MAG: asparagine synthase (glutamine-hydrolyzing) [Clostridia bacterium]|nr:asparagine synthase (glutamine-hydrolyzing) [Clostridia bacterium]
MCGIVGFLNEEKNKPIIIKRMTDRIIHRGPDEEGYYIDENIALGHRRLAIIDIDNGKQPMFSKDNNLVVVFNGEIYNYRELKKELEKLGYKFRTNSDTEVLLYGYEEWKEELPKKLRGMFAFSIWDKKNKNLFCARDHFGIKPFYYYQRDKTFMFASEIKAFLEHPDFEKILNKDLIGPYLSFSFTPTNETLFKGVYVLEPGTSLNFKDNKITVKKYYELDFKEKNDDYKQIVDKIEEVIDDSVKHHMISDVEVGAFLSSGVDSSYIVSLARPNKTYTIGYELNKYSEIEYAKALTKELSIENISTKITKEEYMKTVSKILYYMDEPSCDPSAISLYFVSKEAVKDVKVVMSGEGADEFFGGYNTYREEVDLKLYNKIPFKIRHILANIFGKLPEFRGRNLIVRRGMSLEEEYIGVNKIYSEKERKKIINCKDTIKNQDITKSIFDKFKSNNNIIKMQAIDIRYWLTKDILLKADKMTMANSIESRIPFVDKEVFKIASSLPLEYKISKTNTKVALREAAKKSIPNEAYKKKKLGFPVPLREWMREDDVYNEIKNTINQEFVKEFFNQKYVLKLLEEHKKNKKDNYKKVWAIYSFIKWYEVFFLNKRIEVKRKVKNRAYTLDNSNRVILKKCYYK